MKTRLSNVSKRTRETKKVGKQDSQMCQKGHEKLRKYENKTLNVSKRTRETKKVWKQDSQIR